MKIIAIEHKKGSNQKEHFEWDNYIFHGITSKDSSEKCDFTKIDWESTSGDTITEQYQFKAQYVNQMISDFRFKSIDDFKGKQLVRIMFDNYKKPCYMIVK